MSLALDLTIALTLGCGPRPRVPPLAGAVESIRAAPDSVVALARNLAPTLYLHPAETFPLLRVVAVKHPERPVIAYHLLWRDDVHGAWIPFSNPTDQEVVWVGYDEAGEPSRLWTYWHGTMVGTGWAGRGRPAVDVQWGKHGSLPRGTLQEDLPWSRRLRLFYLFTWAFPDLALGALNRPGPICFCRGYGSYDDFTVPLPLERRLDAVIVSRDPDRALTALFGDRYSRKAPWPWM